MDSSLITSIIGAFQASLSVLVVVFYGVLLSHFHVVSPMGAKEVSKACVRVFLPALLIYDLGNQLHKGNTSNYAIIIAWSLIYNGISLALGSLTTKMLRLPKWVTPAIAFNNSTSLPLLLMDSLSANGLLSLLLKDDQDSSPQALMRARTYFLVNSMVSNCLTFAFGPRLLAEGEVNDTPSASSNPGSSNNEFEQSDITDENSPLLPQSMKHRPREVFESLWTSLPHSLQRLFSFLSDFITAPFIGSVIGVILGTIPALHTAFFAPSHDGGIFTAWLTLSIKNLGQLFASLQILVVGIKLSASLNKMRRGEESGPVPWPIFVGVTAIRYFVWPCASIGIVWAVVGKLGLGSRDPILWFVLMMIPSGPPAMKLGALADVSNGTEQEKLSIAKFLAISYTLCPLISASIVGALRTCEAMREIQ